MTASVSSWPMTTSSTRCFNSVIITVELERITQSRRFFSRINAPKMELVPKIRLVLWLADRMLTLLFIVLAMY